MATTFVLRVWTRFFESPERVWAEKTSTDVLCRAFALGTSLRLEDPEGVQRSLREGTSLETAGRLGPVSWPLAITEVTPGRAFVARSTNALFHVWRHDVLVEPTRDGSRSLDTVTFAPALRGAKALAIATERLFVRRHRADAERLSADLRTIGVSALRVANDEDLR